MGLLEFQKLPVNTLVGADWKTFKGITAHQTIDKGYRTKYRLTKAICWLLSRLNGLEASPLPKKAERSARQCGTRFYSRTLAQRYNLRPQCPGP